MDQLSTPHTTDVGHLIGALEIRNAPAIPGIHDGALEAAGGVLVAGPTTNGMGGRCCGHLDDGLLESVGTTALNPTKFQCGMYPTQRCHSDDGALEAVAGQHVAGPQTRRIPNYLGCI